MAKKREQDSGVDPTSGHPDDETQDVPTEAVSAATGDPTDAGLLEVPGSVEPGADGVDAGAEDAARPASDRDVRDAAVASVSGNHVTIGDSAVLTLAAGSVEANDTLIVVGTVGKLEGNARVLFDTRAAMAMGAVMGLVFAVFVRLLTGGDVEQA